jgi:hypothetical protein
LVEMLAAVLCLAAVAYSPGGNTEDNIIERVEKSTSTPPPELVLALADEHQADVFGTTAFVATVLAVGGLTVAFAVLAWRNSRRSDTLYTSEK